MKNIIQILCVLFMISSYSQIQVSDFTYNNTPFSTPIKYQEFNNKILFKAGTDGYGEELWSSDGTSANTNIVKDLALGESNGLTSFFSTVLNNELYFVANDEFNFSGGEIWKTDGTELGSSLVTNYNGRIYGLTIVGNLIYFTIKTDDYTLQIWKTDGTDSGTEIVKDNMSIWGEPSFQGSLNGLFMFTLQVPSTNNSKVWRSNGTDSGTYPLTGEIDGNGTEGSTSGLSHYILFDNKIFFITRQHLYQTDGTVANTGIVAEVWNAQNNLVDHGDIIEINNKMYFSFFAADLKKLSIYESDGTSGGTSEIYTVTSSDYFFPSDFGISGNDLILTSVNSTGGTSLFQLDTATNLMSEILEIEQNPIENSFSRGRSNLTLNRIDSDRFFFATPSDTFARTIGWIYNETSGSIDRVSELDNVYYRIVYNNDFYYSKNNQVWKFDLNLLSINTLTDSQSVRIYPNPFSDFINFNQSERITDIEIYDINGKLILAIPKLINNKIHINMLNSGTYFLKFKKDDIMVTKKIIKSLK